MTVEENKSTSLRPIPGDSLVNFVLSNIIFFALAGLIIFFALMHQNFFSYETARTIMIQLVPVGILSFAVALLLICGSIDLSVGAIVALSITLGSQAMLAYGLKMGILTFLITGLAAGSLNGLLVGYGRLNPIIITLGTGMIFTGLALVITQGRQLVPPDAFRGIFLFEVFGFRVDVYLLVICGLWSWWILNKSRFGRYLYATGEDEHVAFIMGVNVKRLRFIMHAVTGLVCGLVGMVLVAKLNIGTANMGLDLMLPPLLAVFLGGIRFGGGSGNISGVITGVLFVGVLRSGLLIIGLSTYAQETVIGTALIAAIYSTTIKDWKKAK